MSAATKHAVKESLQELVPLNALSEKSFTEIARKIVIEEVRSGNFLFHKGDRDNQSVYLLDGKIDLIDGHRKVAGEVEAGTDISRYPVANQQPRPLSARAATKVVIARVDSILLDAYLNWEHTSVAEVTEISAADNEDWMTRILQSDAFSRIPPAILQRLIISMQPFPVHAGDVVIRQGDEGDFFFSIHKGRCAVTRRTTPDGEEELLSELSAGDFFGEESLLSASTRNANIIMLTDGLLMRLAKKDFIELLQKPLVNSISHEQAVAMVEEGAVWIDVRSVEEHEFNALEDSVNIPLSQLRDQIPELVFNAKYVIYCDTGHRSTTAAFVLSHKGFEAYVLNGGLTGLAPRRLKDADPQGAEIIAFNQIEEGDANDRDIAEVEADSFGVADGALAAGHLAELEALRTEVDGLRQAARLRKETESKLAEQRVQLGRLQDVIGESNRRISVLQSRLETAETEKHRIQEQYAVLQREHAEESGRFEHERGQSSALVDSLRTELAAGEEERQQLQQRVEATEAERGAQVARIQDELSRSSQRIEALQAELAAAGERASQLQRETDSLRDGHWRLEQTLRDELKQAQLRAESLQAEMTQAIQHHGNAQENLQERLRTIEALHKELDGSRQKVGELESEVASLREQHQALDNGAKAELAQGHEELGRLRNELSTARQQLDVALAETQALRQRIDSLQEDNEALRGEGERLRLQNAEQVGLVEQLATARQAADDALVRLQGEWNIERSALQDEVRAGGERLCELEARLGQSNEAAGREKQELEEELQSRITTYREQLEEQGRRQAELQAERGRNAEALESLTRERDGLQAKLDESLQESAARQRDIEGLNALVASLKSAADGEVQALSERLEAERVRSEEAQSRIESLRAELIHQKESNAGLLVDIESLRKLLEDLREESRQTDERFRRRDQENQETLKKGYEDLTRKNENEKELQGQIERLRKKLEQSEEALQAARHDERESVENIRNELNAERRARAEERAQMAARQRELKEQLISVASRHEEVLAARDGVVAQARDDALEEDHTRLSQIIAAQQQTEQQLAALQDELRRAHEETAAAVRRERERNEADLALTRRQKADADAALGQVELQLKQLMHERDVALSDQQSLREQLSTLSAEVEAAREQMRAGREGLADDPVRLVDELKEAPRNIEIADHRRTGGEAQRDQASARPDELRRGRGDPASTDFRQETDIDAAPPDTPQQPMQTDAAGEALLNAGPASPASAPIGEPRKKTGRGSQGKAWAIGVGMASVAALAFWVLPRTENSGTPKPEDAIVGSTVPAVTAPPIQAGQAVPVRKATTPDASMPNPASQIASSQPLHKVPAATRTPAHDKADAPVIAPLRSFRDELLGGGSAPLMVELPAAAYPMGSAGNSLNFDERPQHLVKLPAFAISRYEVSFAEYDRFVLATGRRLTSDAGWGRDDRPVINVSWRDAQAYAQWLSEQTGHRYRLPSESEWEFAARGGTTTMFWWDGLMNVNPANCFDCGSRWDGTSTAPVGSFPANRFGIHDTAGNVQEWTEDCYYPNYEGAPSDGSARQSLGCTQRVVRGGSYTSPLDSVRSARRGQYDQDTRLDNLGFRLVRIN